MLSRLVAHASMRSNIVKALQHNRYQLQNVVFKRDSGHNTIMVRPSSYEARFLRNWFHFYFLLVGIPISVILSIINIRANPELTEIPEGYEPRHWEYCKHPITRFVARYLYYPLELEHELKMACYEFKAEERILNHLSHNIEKIMKFYNDHRSREFAPSLLGDYIRKSRETWEHGMISIGSMQGEVYESAYKADTVIPTEGYKDGPIDGM